MLDASAVELMYREAQPSAPPPHEAPDPHRSWLLPLIVVGIVTAIALAGTFFFVTSALAAGATGGR